MLKSDNMSEDDEKLLKCNACDEEIEECDECGKELEESQSIICFEDGEHHFCSEECMEKFLDENVLEAMTYLDNE